MLSFPYRRKSPNGQVCACSHPRSTRWSPPSPRHGTGIHQCTSGQGTSTLQASPAVGSPPRSAWPGRFRRPLACSRKTCRCSTPRRAAGPPVASASGSRSGPLASRTTGPSSAACQSWGSCREGHGTAPAIALAMGRQCLIGLAPLQIAGGAMRVGWLAPISSSLLENTKKWGA